MIADSLSHYRIIKKLGAGVNLANAFRSLNRFDEAKEIYEQALAHKLETTGYHASLYTIAFVRGDTAAMQPQLDWARGKPNEYLGAGAFRLPRAMNISPLRG